MLDIFFEIHANLISQLSSQFIRAARHSLDLEAPALGIYGPRGVGKTTMLLQHGQMVHGGPEACLYISADHVAVAAAGLFALGRAYFQQGGQALILDEIHRAPDWGRQVKSLIDSYPNKKFYLSGSSALALRETDADLSRRVLWSKLPCLSFREFLHLAHQVEFPSLSLQDILANHPQHAMAIKTRRPAILADLKDYLTFGYYPFFVQGKQGFQQRLLSIIEKVLADDIPDLFGLDRSKISSLRRLLWIVCSSAPFSPNIDGLSRDLGLAKESVYTYLECLEKSGLLKSYRAFVTGGKIARKAAKIYPANANMLTAIVSQASLKQEMGMVRETFLQSSLSETHTIHTHAKADFLVDGSLVIEVGGPSKDFRQIQEHVNDGYLALDGIEVGNGLRIPLYLFGFLY